MVKYSVMRLVGVWLVRNSKQVKWERLMVQCWSRDQIYMSYNDTKKKKTIKETLTVGFNHAVADPGEGSPYFYTKLTEFRRAGTMNWVTIFASWSRNVELSLTLTWGSECYDDNLSLSSTSHPALVGLYWMVKLASFLVQNILQGCICLLVSGSLKLLTIDYSLSSRQCYRHWLPRIVSWTVVVTKAVSYKNSEVSKLLLLY